MSLFEFIGELCTVDSRYVRGWRWVFSADYRREVRQMWIIQNRFLVACGAIEAAMLLLAEIVAVVFLGRWVFGW